MALDLTQTLTEMSTTKCFWRLKRGRLTKSPPPVRRLSRKYGILNTPQHYRPPRSVTGIDFPLLKGACVRNNVKSLTVFLFNLQGRKQERRTILQQAEGSSTVLSNVLMYSGTIH
jgi:hypothetical protein